MSQNSQVKGQPREILNADIEILVEFEQIEARDRSFGDVDLEFGALNTPER